MQYQAISHNDLQKHARWLRRLAFDLTHNQHAADDLVQDTFVAVLRRDSPMPNTAEPGGTRAYLAGVLRNLYRMAVRTDVRREKREVGSFDHGTAPAPDQVVDARWASHLLLEEVERLSEPFRTTLLLRYYDGLRSQQIAEQLGVPPATVRKRNQLALTRLRARLEQRTQDDGRSWMRAVSRGLLPLAPAGWMRRVLRLQAVQVTAVAALVAGAVAVSSRFVDLKFPAGATASTNPAQTRHASPPGSTAIFAAAFPDADFESQNEYVPEPPSEALQDDDDADDHSTLVTTAEHRRCGQLQAKIDATPAGGTLHVPAGCIYREKALITKSMHLLAPSGSEIRGSDVWTKFVQHGATWVSADTLPPFIDKDQDCVRRTQGPCMGPEQVFRNGVPLERVGGEGLPGEQQFSLNKSRQIVLGASPEGHQIEVTTRLGWISVAAEDVTISGFTMRHAASHLYALAVINPSQRVTVRNNEFSHASGTAVSLAGIGHKFENNLVAYTGFEALRLEPGSGAHVLGNEIHHGSQRRAPGSWKSGGVAVLLHPNASFSHNHIHHNHGMAVVNIRSDKVDVIGNSIHDNWGGSIAYVGASGGQITNNRAWSNGHNALPPEPALFLAGTQGVTAAHNIFAHHPFGMYIGPIRKQHLPAGFDTCLDTANNVIHDNVVIAEGAGKPQIRISGDPREEDVIAPCASNRLERNRQWPANANAHASPLTAFEKDALLAKLPH